MNNLIFNSVHLKFKIQNNKDCGRALFQLDGEALLDFLGNGLIM